MFTTKLKAAALAIAAFGTIAATAPSAEAKGYSVYETAVTYNFPSWDVLNARAWPASHSQLKFGIPKGRVVFVQRCILKSGTDWCKVKYNGQTGWVNGRFIQSHWQNYADVNWATFKGWH